MLTVRIQEKNYSESIMVLKLKDGKKIFYKCSEAEETGLHVQGAGTDCKKDCRLQIGMIPDFQS